MRPRLTLPILSILLLLLSSCQLSLGQAAGIWARAEAIFTYRLLSSLEIRESRQYSIDTDDRGWPKPPTRTLEQVSTIDEWGHTVRDSIPGRPSMGLLTINRYRGDLLLASKFSSYPDDPDSYYRHSMYYDGKGVLLYALLREPGKGDALADSTRYYYDETGEVVKEIRFRFQKDEKNDTTTYHYDQEGKLVREHTRGQYFDRVTELRYDEERRVVEVSFKEHYHHDGRDDVGKMTFHYGEAGLCKQMEYYFGEGPRSLIKQIEYYDREGKLIEN